MITVIIIVEGYTEKVFVNQVLNKYLTSLDIRATLIGKAGGSVTFPRAMKDINNSLGYKNAYVSTMFDFYGICREWPGKKDITELKKTGKSLTSLEMGKQMNEVMYAAVKNEWGGGDGYGDGRITRFKPYFQIHEFEALLFSDRDILAKHLNCKPDSIDISEDNFSNPEMINDDENTAPSKRIDRIFNSRNAIYDKTTIGINLAKKLGIDLIRKKCPNFNSWLSELEALTPLD